WYDGVTTFVATTVGADESVPGTAILQSGLSGCNSAQVTLLKQALNQALADVATIGGINPGYLDRVLKGLGRGMVVYGCNVPSCLDSSVVASTSGPATDPFPDAPTAGITVINPSVFAAGKDAVEEIIIHEWFHFAGMPHQDNDTSGNQQRD